eukprot:jgi/Picsp_1/3506/NSC_06344-R1_beta- -galactosyltransferase sqv-2
MRPKSGSMSKNLYRRSIEAGPGDDGVALTRWPAGTGSKHQVNTGDCNVLHFSVRPRPKSNAAIPGLTGRPVPGKMAEVTPSSGIASLQEIRSGRAIGWACNRGEKRERISLALAVDGIIVKDVELKDVYSENDSDVVRSCDVKGLGSPQKPIIFSFNITLPVLPEGKHRLQVIVPQKDETFVESYHSPMDFIESYIEPGLKETIARKDKIITQRNNQLAHLWDEIKTQLPWKRVEEEFVNQDRSKQVDADRILALILVHSAPQSAEQRDAVRQTWGQSFSIFPGSPRTTGVSSAIRIKFMVGSEGIAMHKANLEAEISKYDDVFKAHSDPMMAIRGGSSIHHVLQALAEFTSSIDANFYIITHDKMLLIPDRLTSILKPISAQGNLYLGCTKSGEVITDENNQWFERDHWRFGDAVGESKAQYPRHAHGDFYGFSRHIARYIARNRDVLQIYSNEDTTIGAWMLGLSIEHMDEGSLCCSLSSCHRRSRCAVYSESQCGGICNDHQGLVDAFKSCNRNKARQ